MPETRGNALTHVSATGHRPLPTVDQATYRNAHQQHDPKLTSTFDWDWNKTPCTMCGAKTVKGDLHDGVCPGCRGITRPAPAAAPAGLRSSKTGEHVFQTFDQHDLETRYQPAPVLPELDGEHSPQVENRQQPDSEPAEHDPSDQGPKHATAQVSPAEQPTPGTNAETIADAAERAATILRAAAPVDVLTLTCEHATRTLTRAHGIRDPLAGMLRTAALSAIAALDHYLELHHPETTQPVTPGLGGTRPAAEPEGEAGRQPATFHTFHRPPRGPGGRPRTVITQDTIDDVVARYRNDQSLIAIGIALRMSKTTVRRILTDANIPIRLRPAQPLDLAPDTEQAIIAAYLTGTSSSDVGAQFHVRAETVRALAVAAGHPIHPRGQATKAIGVRLQELGITSRQVKDWAVSTGLLATVARGSVAHSVIDAYVAAHPAPDTTLDTAQEGPA